MGFEETEVLFPSREHKGEAAGRPVDHRSFELGPAFIGKTGLKSALHTPEKEGAGSISSRAVRS